MLLFGLGMSLGGAGSAEAAVVPTVGLGTAAAFGVLGGSTVTNTGPSTINGLDVGVSPGTAITGFPPGIITAPGTRHAADAVAGNGQRDALTAYNNAAGRSAAPADRGLTDLVGRTLQPGVYQGNLSLSGTVTLDNRTTPDAVFIFQASSTLITSTSSVVRFTTSHASCNVFWQVGSSATLGTGSTFVGTVLAHTSVTANTGATVTGRLLAATGAVTLDTNVIRAPSCATPPSSSSSSTSTGATTATPTSTRVSTSAPGENTTASTITLLTTTGRTSGTGTRPSTAVTTTPGTTTSTARTTRLTQPSFPTGVPGGRGPTAGLSPLKAVGAALVLLAAGLLMWRSPTVRRRLTRWTRFLATSLNRSGDHR